MPSAPPSKVLLIGWDAADWKVIMPLLDAGLMPTLDKLISHGVMGNIATLQPVLSPMLWTSIATGKRADKHGILGFIEPDPDTGRVRPVTSTSRKCKAIWNILADQGLRANVVGWFAGHPAEPINGVSVSNLYPHARGSVSAAVAGTPPGSGGLDTGQPLGSVRDSDARHPVPAAAGMPYGRDGLHAGRPPASAGGSEAWPMPDGTVHPSRLADTLAELRVHPGEITADHLLPLVPQAARVDQTRDQRLAVLARLLAECTSIHAAATWIMEHEPWDFMGVYYNTIDHACHGFASYHPPRMAQVSEQDFELYKGVVDGVYRFHDMMLARLLALAGDDATVIVVSDHGFHCDHLRPKGLPKDDPAGPAVWHRPYGMLCMKGPGIRRDERIYGATLLDIAPTVLTLLGLPVGEDMDGRVLRQAFDEPPAVRSIPTWEGSEEEEERGRRGEGQVGVSQSPPLPVSPSSAPSPSLDLWQTHAMLQQLVELGYVDAPSEDDESNVRMARRERACNLARVHLDAGRCREAAELLETLHQEHPDQARFTLHLAQAYHGMGDLARCRVVVEKLLATGQHPSRADLLMGSLQFAEGRIDEALERLRRAESANPRLPGLHCRIGQVYLRQARWKDAERAFGRALEIDGDSAHAHDGLSAALLGQHRDAEAAEAALRAVGLLHFLPRAHFHLGVALARQGMTDRAILAFETCLSLRPEHADAHRWLARIYDQAVPDPAKAHHHRQIADRLTHPASTLSDPLAEQGPL